MWCWLKSIGMAIGAIGGGAILVIFVILLQKIIDKWEWMIYVIAGLLVAILVILIHSSMCG